MSDGSGAVQHDGLHGSTDDTVRAADKACRCRREHLSVHTPAPARNSPVLQHSSSCCSPNHKVQIGKGTLVEIAGYAPCAASDDEADAVRLLPAAHLLHDRAPVAHAVQQQARANLRARAD